MSLWRPNSPANFSKLFNATNVVCSMVQSLLYWCELFDRLKFQSLCLDIETVSLNGPISVVGTYRPREGAMESDAFVRGRNLSADVLKAAFADCKMLITFNGRHFDVPHIRKWFPGAIPETMPVIDLYLIARHLNLNASLKVLESTFRIERRQQRRGKAVRLWKRYERFKDKCALDQLLDYNRQDTINLYPLAEELIALARQGCRQAVV